MRVFLMLILTVALVFVSYRLAEVERERYVLELGLCSSVLVWPEPSKCIRDAEPRTSMWWNLYYGLSN